MERDWLGPMILHRLHDAVEGLVRGVGFGSSGKIDGGLPQGEVAFRNSQEVDRLLGGNSLLESPRIGQPDIFDGHANQPARDIHAILAGFEHPAEPVKGCIYIARPYGFMQRRNDVVMLLPGLVVEQHLPLDRILDGFGGELAIFGSCGCKLQDVVCGTGIAVGIDRDLAKQIFRRLHSDNRQRTAQQPHDLFLGERLEHVDLGPRKQRRDYFEGWIFGRGADQDDVAALNVRKERILLGLVEAMDLVDENKGAATQPAVALGIGHHSLDLLYAAEHGAKRDEIAMGETRDDSRQSGFADARRSPENDGTELIALDLLAQRFARREDMLLACELL